MWQNLVKYRPKSFFFNDTATTEIYTLSLHDALPISSRLLSPTGPTRSSPVRAWRSMTRPAMRDRKSTRLNSSHVRISYAVFCLKKKKRHVGGDRVESKSPAGGIAAR